MNTKLLGAAHGLPEPRTEYVFCDGRKWRFDYAWPDLRVALEVEGGVWIAGRHTRGKGFIADIEKYNTAAAMGWLVIRVVPDDLLKSATGDFLRAAMQRHIARIEKYE